MTPFDDGNRDAHFAKTETPERLTIAADDGEPVIVINFAPEEPSAEHAERTAAPAAEGP